MDISFEYVDTKQYRSGSQKARVITEAWISKNMYCPRCGNLHINHFENNRPVADFYCPNCKNEFELKSKRGPLSKKVNGGSYFTMVQRITSNKNPDFFFMNYSKESQQVVDLILIPKNFFVPDIIEKRNPLSITARRAGWVGCNIMIDKIPLQGRIEIIKNGIVADKTTILQKVNEGKRLEINDLNTRGWIMDVLNCVNNIPTETFSLSEIYKFIDFLSAKHPKNNNVKAKIRQQLQSLRDFGFIEFIGHGLYKKLL